MVATVQKQEGITICVYFLVKAWHPGASVLKSLVQHCRAVAWLLPEVDRPWGPVSNTRVTCQQLLPPGCILDALMGSKSGGKMVSALQIQAPDT